MNINILNGHSGLAAASAKAEIQEGREGGMAEGCPMMTSIRSWELV